jgi:hypothetical protein
MGFGGPVWHASVSPQGGAVVRPESLFQIALDELSGVGDASRGEWREVGSRAVHVRRRLSADEESRVGPVVDIRGTFESEKRCQRIRKFLPPQLASMECQ